MHRGDNTNWHPLGGKQAATRFALAVARTQPVALMIQVLEWLDRSREPVLPVLMYHRVDGPERSPELDPSLLSATPGEFEQQVQYLAAARRVLSLSDLLELRRGRMELPPRAVAVTFDDAYRDFKEQAWPVLQRHRVPVTLFVPTAFPDDPRRAFWWDRLHAALATTERRNPMLTPAGRVKLGTARDRELAFRSLRDWVKATRHDEAMSGVDSVVAELDGHQPTSSVLDWAELRELAGDGVDLGPHTRTHPLLDRVTLTQAKDEILGSAADLEREVGSQARALAFPSGALTSELVDWLPEAGFEMAFTTARGGNHLGHVDWLRMRRINVGRRSGLSVIRAQLLSWPTRARCYRLPAET